ncbi:MAG TPA: LLM class flavin-dependent oxidoreductase [Solirubrobacteraceae bacterium]|nr:LLM class flavin-dependent oxidoreductase [Solirubrobacteraceae bacterium]
MRFGFLTEGDTHPGTTHYHRYFEVVEEVLLAEKVGFDLFGSSEQHFAIGGATISAPETLYPYLIGMTSRIRFIHAVTLLPRNFNHPLRVAERLATEDILSDGRVELGTGRSNTTLAMRAFEVDPKETKSQWNEGLDLIRAAFLNDPFSFEGEHYNVPPRSLVPKPVQLPHPPLSVAATSPESHRQAAEKGIGVFSSSSFLGYEYNRSALAIYDDVFDATSHPFPVTRSKGILIGGAMHCAESTKQARDEVLPAVEYARLAVGAYERLSKLSADYAYMGAVKDVRFDDIDWMLQESGNFIVGDPDACVSQLRVLEEMGIDTVLLRIDSLPHDQLMRSIELFGKYVIPHFKAPSTVVRPADDVLNDIRAMRPQHEERINRLREEAAAAATTS